jgi:tetratricopeptide (TPR) repeat protein
VQGQGEVYICDRCVGLCNDIVAERTVPRDPIARARSVLLDELASLSWPIPLAISGRLVDAAIALAPDDVTALREIARAAAAVGDTPSALAALSRIPEPHRTAVDRMEMAVHHDWAGEGELALQVLATVDAGELAEPMRTVLGLHRAFMTLAHRCCAPDEALALERQAEEGFRALASFQLEETHRRALEREVTLARAHAARATGGHARAEAILREHLGAHEQDASAWALLHDVHEDLGEHEHARAARLRALEHAHPAGAVARRLREKGKEPLR